VESASGGFLTLRL